MSVALFVYIGRACARACVRSVVCAPPCVRSLISAPECAIRAPSVGPSVAGIFADSDGARSENLSSNYRCVAPANRREPVNAQLADAANGRPRTIGARAAVARRRTTSIATRRHRKWQPDRRPDRQTEGQSDGERNTSRLLVLQLVGLPGTITR